MGAEPHHGGATAGTAVWFPTAHEALPALLGLAVAVAALAYLVAAHRTRVTPRPWPVGRALAFAAGAVLVAAAVSPPLAGLVHTDARAHTAQHLLLGMLAPLGLVLGAPGTLLLRSLPRRAARGLAAVLRSGPVHVLTHPLTAAALSAGGLWVLHVTPLYRLAAERPAVHALVLLHLLLAGCLVTWSLVGPDPAPRRPGVPTRLAALLLAAAAHAVLAKLLYARAGSLPPGAGLSAAEVREAAQWMYYGGDAVEVVLLVVLLSAWYRRRARASDRAARGSPTVSTRMVLHHRIMRIDTMDHEGAPSGGPAISPARTRAGSPRSRPGPTAAA